MNPIARPDELTVDYRPIELTRNWVRTPALNREEQKPLTYEVEVQCARLPEDTVLVAAGTLEPWYSTGTAIFYFQESPDGWALRGAGLFNTTDVGPPGVWMTPLEGLVRIDRSRAGHLRIHFELRERREDRTPYWCVGGFDVDLEDCAGSDSWIEASGAGDPWFDGEYAGRWPERQ